MRVCIFFSKRQLNGSYSLFTEILITQLRTHLNSLAQNTRKGVTLGGIGRMLRVARRQQQIYTIKCI